MQLLKLSVMTNCEYSSALHTLHDAALLHGKLDPFRGDMDLNLWRKANTVKKLAELFDRCRHCVEYWDGVLGLYYGRHGEFSYHGKTAKESKEVS